MKAYMSHGLSWVKEHIYIAVILFLYQLLWGFFVYRFIDGTVLPVLQRYPDPAPTEMTARLFLAESQFHLMKTNDYLPFLWTLAAFILIRLLLTPFIRAGVFYSMARQSGSGLAFFEGIKLIWKPMLLLYWLETVLIALPAYWFIPHAVRQFADRPTLAAVMTDIVPYAALWLLGAWVVRQLFLSMQFGAASELSILHALLQGIRRMAPLLGLSAIFAGIALLSGLLFTAAAMLWTGLTALILQQAFPAVRTLLQLWGLSSRYSVWQQSGTEEK